MAEILLSLDGECSDYKPDDCNPDTELLELTPEYATLLTENPVTFMPQVEDNLAAEVRERLQNRYQACLPFWSQNVSVEWGRTDVERIAETLRDKTPEDINAFQDLTITDVDPSLLVDDLYELSTNKQGMPLALEILDGVHDRSIHKKTLETIA